MAGHYIVVFDRNAQRDYVPFHNALTKDPAILNWWHYIKACYIIKTDLTANALSALVRKYFEENGLDKAHLVLAVDVAKRQGWLTEDAWKWLREQESEE